MYYDAKHSCQEKLSSLNCIRWGPRAWSVRMGWAESGLSEDI